jgi:TetR/AcrR family transcriptional regulator, cholesterol catabolism regulator
MSFNGRESTLKMNSMRGGLQVSSLHRRIKSKHRQARVSLPAGKSTRESPQSNGKDKPSGDKALATKSEKSRDSILAAAARLFRQQGYSATTLRQIAGMAEIKAGSIYYYFDSKEAILDEVLDQGLHRIFEAVKTALKKAGDVSHRRRIGLAIETHLAALLEASDFTSANIRLYGQLPERLKKRHRPLRRAYAKYWDRLFLDARRAGEIRADIEIVPLRIFVLGALNWTVEWFSFGNKETVRKLARRTELLIFDGVTKR